jgi:hypothetical protein
MVFFVDGTKMFLKSGIRYLKTVVHIWSGLSQTIPDQTHIPRAYSQNASVSQIPTQSVQSECLSQLNSDSIHTVRMPLSVNQSRLDPYNQNASVYQIPTQSVSVYQIPTQSVSVYQIPIQSVQSECLSQPNPDPIRTVRMSQSTKSRPDPYSHKISPTTFIIQYLTRSILSGKDYQYLGRSVYSGEHLDLWSRSINTWPDPVFFFRRGTRPPYKIQPREDPGKNRSSTPPRVS